MQKIDAKELLAKYKLGTCTPAEKDIVETWYQQLKLENPELTEDAIENSLGRIWIKLDNGPIETTIRLWPRIAGLAAAIVVITLGTWLYYPANTAHHPQFNSASPTHVNNIKPGKVGATLILANGKRILLNDAGNGQLAKEAGVVISKTTDGQLIYEVTGTGDGGNRINTLSTSKGETYMVILPDKSKVWLNAASSLKYPASFENSSERSVELSGEAYFEITKNKDRPFKVLANHQNITVLGTHFNVMAYAEEDNIYTTLLEGSVLVGNTTREIQLKPGQQSILNKGSDKISIKAVDADESVAWKDGYFLFQGENIYSIMRKISRWYDVEVVYEGNMENKEFAGMISRFKDISEVLKMLQLTGDVHYKIDERRILVMP